MSDPQFDAIDGQLNAAADGRFRVFGIRRTGQHAIINWILRNCGRDQHVFLNSCKIAKSAIRTCQQSEISSQSADKAHNLRKTLEKILDFGAKPFVLISYEAGYPPDRYERGDLTNGFANEDFDHQMLVTRSFVNWLPSFINLWRKINPNSPPQGLHASNAIVFEMLRYKDHLIAAIASPHTIISYDAWFADAAYRQAKLAELDLSEIDNSFGDVQKYGGGSSFSQWALPAAELDIGNRWKTMIGDPYARQLLALAANDKQFLDALAAVYPEDIDVLNSLLV